MLIIKQNTAEPPMPVRLVQAADGLTEITGKVTGDFTITRSKNGGAEFAGTGTITEIGHGNYCYNFGALETSDPGFLLIEFEVAGARTFVGLAQVVVNVVSDVAADTLSMKEVTDAFKATLFGPGNVGSLPVSMQIAPTGAIGVSSLAFSWNVNLPPNFWKGLTLVAFDNDGPMFSRIRSSSATGGVSDVVTLAYDALPKVPSEQTFFTIIGEAPVPRSESRVVYRRVGGQLVKLDDISIVRE